MMTDPLLPERASKSALLKNTRAGGRPRAHSTFMDD